MEFFDSLIQIGTNWDASKRWEKEQQDRELQRQELHKKYPASSKELEEAQQYGRTIIDTINTMDLYSINKGQDVETMGGTAKGLIDLLGMGIGGGLGWLAAKSQINKKVLKANNEYAWIIAGASAFLGYTFSNIFGSIASKQLEKEASRIARYQAREIELQDERNFVVYTPEQIEQAKQIAKNIPNPVIKHKKKSSLNIISEYSNAVKSIVSLGKDHEKYLKWRNEHIEKESAKEGLFKTMNPSAEQLEKAKNDRDSLLQVVKKIEINSQNYLSNVEMAINSVMACEFIVGAIGGVAVSLIMMLAQKLGQLPKNSNKVAIVEKVMPIVMPVVLMILGTPYFIKLEKEASKVGRFKAKQELLNNPNSFINYTDEQKKSVKDIKAPNKKERTLVEKFKDNIKLFAEFKNDFLEYKKYVKTTEKEEIKINKALKQVEVKPEQLKEAKNLQKNVFYTFETMDEKTQRLANDSVGAADIIKMASNLIIMGVGLFAIDKIIIRNLAKDGLDTMNYQKRYKENHIKYAPVFFISSIVGMLMEIQAVQVKKQAVKIGLMSAMNDLNDPKNFVNLETPDGFSNKPALTVTKKENISKPDNQNPTLTEQAAKFINNPI